MYILNFKCFCKDGVEIISFIYFPISTGTKALEDAGLSYDAIEQACVGYVYGKYMFKPFKPSKWRAGTNIINAISIITT